MIAVQPDDGYTDPDDGEWDAYDAGFYEDCYCCTCCGHTDSCYGIEEDE